LDWQVKELNCSVWGLCWSCMLISSDVKSDTLVMFLQATRSKSSVTLQTSPSTKMPCLVTAVLWLREE
jgi:hypothetical protein